MQTPVTIKKVITVIIYIVVGTIIGFIVATRITDNHEQINITKFASKAKNKDVAKKIERIIKLADSGDPAAQTKLGILYERGAGVAKDPMKSAQLYQKASNQHFANAQYLLAGLYAKGNGVSKDLNKSLDLYEQAAAEGYAPAQFYLGFLYQNGDGVPEDPSKAAEYYQKAVNQGYAPAQFFLGSLYEKGLGVPKNMDKAIALYQDASNQEDDAATVYLGYIYENGIGVPKDLKKAAEYYNKIKTISNTKTLVAQSPVSTSKPMPDDCVKQYEEATNYDAGMNVVHIDLGESIRRLKQLASENCPEALARLALYAKEQGRSIANSDKAARELANLALAEGLDKRADEGYADAKFLLGFFYQYGLGVPKDINKSNTLHFEAAADGYTPAEFWMGRYYYDPLLGYGNNSSKAASWYQKAADKGDAWAQEYLGLLYKKGIGVLQDDDKADQLFHQAIEQGLGQTHQRKK